MTQSALIIGALALLVLVLVVFYLMARIKARRLETILATKDAEIATTKEAAEKAVTHANQTAAASVSTAIADAELRIASANQKAAVAVAAAKEQSDAALRHYETEVKRTHQESRKWLNNAQELVDKERAELKNEISRIRTHYETEARKALTEADTVVTNTLNEIASLRKYQSLRDAELETRGILADALKEASSLKADAAALLEVSRTAAKEERSLASKKASDLRAQADQLLDRATQNAARIVEDAHKNAEQIAGDAYTALRDKDKLEQAAKAIRNIIDGYGDRYIIPTHSLIDDLASDYGHTEAGKMLAAAREQSARMVEEGLASACDYAETARRQTAIKFVIDAFNGRVDALLTEAEHENYGTLEQRIKDAFSVVNLNGQAFRNARILPSYLEARLTELKWAVIAYELRQKEREEQRRIKEQIREEEKARREYERAIRESQEEEEKIQRAITLARNEAAQASSQERDILEQEIAALNQKLLEAEEKNKRAISMAQQTKKGNVYVISNVGSFGEEIFKIGMTRRINPQDRIWELSDASVPFDFDVHAMIACDDAPALEAALHSALDDLRINKVNYRKEFFRVPLERIRTLITERRIEASFTMLAEAHEYRETQALSKMSPAERERYQSERAATPTADVSSAE